MFNIFMADFEDEILIKDQAGKFKILRGGKIYDLDETAAAPAAPAPHAMSKPAEEVLKQSGIKLDENLKPRFGEIIEAYKKDIRDKLETKSTLMRPVTAGGMGLSRDEADLAIKTIETEKNNGTKIEKVSKTAPSAMVAPAPKIPVRPVTPKPMIPKPTSAPKLAAMPPSKSVPKVLPSAMATALTPAPQVSTGVAEFVFSPADEAEILAHAEKLPQVLAGLKPVDVAKFIDEIIKKSGAVLDAANQKKLETILLTRFKDIRDGFETQETLANVTAGITLTPEQMGKILSAAKAKFQELEEKIKKEQLGKVKRAMEEERAGAEKVRQGAEEKIRGKIDERWQEITKKGAPGAVMPSELISPPIGLRQKVSTLAPPTPTSVLSTPIVGAGKLPPAGQIQEMKGVGSKTAEKVGAPSGRQEAIVSPKIKSEISSEGEPKPLEILKPATPPAIRRPPSIRDNRPRLDDVKYVPKLVGPIEELKEMTLVDFRRFGNDPKVAVQKIKDKLNILERESITKKIDGIKAWQESEINKIYKEISREVLLKGVPANQVISLRASANQPTLTVDEYRAVMELNRALRY